MKNRTGLRDSLSLHLRLQVAGEKRIALGPGKIELLSLIAETSSISEAARRMNMSYMKAWSMVQSMKPLVAATRGGNNRGGATLTETGRKALALYQKMERDSRKAGEPTWKKLRLLLREAG